MTSYDGLTWTARTSAADNNWTSVTYGNGIFVAVANSGTGNRVMTSPDGITWNTQTSAADNSWTSVTYTSFNIFVAVANSGTGNRVMTSPDGITWNTQTSAADNNWDSVSYSTGEAMNTLVAVANSGTGNRVMTSYKLGSDSYTQNTPNSNWSSVTYGNGMFVAVASSSQVSVMTTSGSVSIEASTTAATSTFVTPGESATSFSAIVLASTTPITSQPTEGQSYATSSNVGGATVVCSYAVTITTLYSCPHTGLLTNTAYYIKVFLQDYYGNWNLGTQASQYPFFVGTSTITLGNGSTTQPVTLYPGATATTSNTFTLQTSSSTASISSVTLALGTSTSQALSLVEITNNAGGTVYGSVSNPASDTATISLSGLTASTTLTQYRIRITPKTHTNMPVAPGTTYTFTPYVTDWVSNGIHLGSNVYTGTTSVVTIDNVSPSNPSSVSASVTKNEQILFQYVNPSDTDATSTVILRSLNTSFDTPVEGTIYAAGNTLTTSVVACVKNSITPGVTDSCAYTTPSRSTKYFFKVFSQDKAGNFSTGQTVTASGIVIPSPAGGGFLEGYSGATTTTNGGNRTDGSSTSGSSGATTTTSTSSPTHGGGGGDVGMINYNGSTYAVTDVPFYESIFNFFTSALTSSAPQAYAETSSQKQNSCAISLFGTCLVPGTSWLDTILH
jgi:hypothetical protein